MDILAHFKNEFESFPIISNLQLWEQEKARAAAAVAQLHEQGRPQQQRLQQAPLQQAELGLSEQAAAVLPQEEHEEEGGSTSAAGFSLVSDPSSSHVATKEDWRSSIGPSGSSTTAGCRACSTTRSRAWSS